MFKTLIASIRRRRELKAMLRREGCSVVIADLNLTASHRPLTRTESNFLHDMYRKRTAVNRLRLLRMNELANKQMAEGLTPVEAEELLELMRMQRNG